MSVTTSCRRCKHTLQADWAHCGYCGLRLERRERPRQTQPTTFELRAVFHRLWSSQVGATGYNKHDWQELQHLLFRRTGLKL